MAMAWPDERSSRRELVEIAREIYVRKLGAAGDGNLSVRVGADRLLATPSGCHKGRLQPNDFIAVDLAGRVLDHSGRKPSSELSLHLAAYARRDDIRAVIHAHPPMALACNLAGVQLSDVIVSEVVFAFGQAATAPYTTPTTDDVGRVLGEYLACYDVVVMPRHGSVTVGATLEQALIRLDALEHTAHVVAMARLMGGGQPLPAAEVNRLYERAYPDSEPRWRQPGANCPPLEPGAAPTCACGGSCGGTGGGAGGGKCGGTCGGASAGADQTGHTPAPADDAIVAAVLRALGSGERR